MTTQPPPRNFQTLLQAGTTAIREGDAHEALAIFQQAAALAADDAQAAEAACMLGRCYGTLGRYAEAESALREALQRAVGSPSVLARTKMQMGIVRWQRGQLDAAKAFLVDAEQSFKRLGDTRNRANALGNLGIVFLQRGEYQPAADAIRTSLELNEGLNDLAAVAIQSNNLGECYRELGDAERARDLHQRAITLSELLKTPGLEADAWRNLGMDLSDLGEAAGALEAIEHALALAESYHHLDIYQQTLGSLAELRFLRGEYEPARQAAERLVDMAADVPTWRAQGRLVLAQCQLAADAPAAALETLEQALQEAQKSSSKNLVLRLHAALGTLTTHPAIASVHERIAREMAQEMADSFTDQDLRARFVSSPLARRLLA